jgi:exodeoxyribonuclease V gamma subunit
MMHRYSAGRASALAGRLAEVLAEPPPDPLTPEWLAVPSDGMRRWLTLELARRLGNAGPGSGDGVAANIIRAYPGTLRSTVLAAGRGEDDPDPWRIDRLVWSVLEAVDRPVDDPAVAAWLAQSSVASGYPRARRVADLFDRYHLHRPEMVRAWATGIDVDGTGRPLADHDLWQAHLWRSVRQRVGEPSPPELLPELLGRLGAGTLEVDLPGRIVLFGFTLLPSGGFLKIADAVARRRDVHLFVLEPSHLLPDALLRASPSPPGDSGRPRTGDPTAELVHHPLLRSWGRLWRETALLMADAEAGGVPAAPRVDAPMDTVPADDPVTTLLGQLQHDIRANAEPSASLVVDATDRSVQFHACYGPTRQVEVLRDAVLHLLAAPGTDLTEDDIVVLCPALERFAPLIEAVFGRSAEPGHSTLPGSSPVHGQAPSLRYRIADQSMTSTNPVLSATSALMELVAGRFDATSVLDFVALGPVRERFGFDDDELAVIAEWVTDTNVRWGLDADHRVRFGVPGSVAANTWRAALERLLIGSAVLDEDLRLAIGGTAPYGVEGSDVDTLGRLSDVLWHLAELAEQTAVSQPIDEWIDRVRSAAGALFAATPELGWQTETLERLLSGIVEAATTEGVSSPTPLNFSDVRRVFDERLNAEVGRPDFFRGGITVTSMRPLRWVPFRVVCLLGMDQSAFGSSGAAGDDLTAVGPQLGDRDPRGEMRESLLEAVLAAGDHLVLVRDGCDVRTNQPIPMSVAAAELFEAVMGVVAPAGRDALAHRLEISHPRQPFDERCFEVGRYLPGEPWGFDRGDLEGALARRSRSDTPPVFLASPLEPVDTEVVDLAELHAFLLNPATAFFQRRLEARIPRAEEKAPPTLPVEIGGLEGWRIGSRLLEARLSGSTADRWAAVERAMGTLPPGSLGDRELAKLERVVGSLVDTARLRGMEEVAGEPYAVDAELPDGTRVVGSVLLRLHPTTPGPARLYYSRVKPSHRVAAWLDLMALVSTDPSTAWRSLAVSRPLGISADPAVTDLVPSASMSEVGAGARAALAVAVDCFRRGMTEPIPLFPSFSYDLYKGYAPSKKWNGYPSSPKDGDHPAVRLAFGDASFEDVMEIPARPTDPIGRMGRVWRFATYLHQTIDKSTSSRPVPSGQASSGGEASASPPGPAV